MDIETDGLVSTKIHVVSIYNPKTDKISSMTDVEAIKKFFVENTCSLIGHNIQRWDIPELERLLDIKISCQLIDTLVLSWYLYPEKNRHGLEVWGDVLGVEKPKITDWKNLLIRDYTHRCETDVKINKLLWDKLWDKLVELYGGEADAIKLIRYLEFKMDCAKEQESSRWKLDVEKCEAGVKELSEERERRTIELKKGMPMVQKYVKKSRPKKPFKSDGTRSSTGERWFTLLKSEGLEEDFEGELDVPSKLVEPKPSSHKQIKDWLYSLGWKPQTIKFDRNKKTGDIKQIPQVSLDKGRGVCPSVKKLYVKEPLLENLDGLSIIAHRISILNGFLKEVSEDGYVKAEIQGLTNTLRFKHAVCVNLPGVDKPYGELVRGCLTAPEGYELCGSDMASLEDRTKQHLMWEHDPAYVREMMTDDFDPHLDLAIVAGALTPEQVQAHKDGRENHEDIRKIYKAANYACVYGAGAATIARAAGLSLKEGKALVDTYWERNWSVRVIPTRVTTKKTGDGSMWLQNPVSKFWYSLRAEKDIFSTLNQGLGVFCFDMWVGFVRRMRPQLTAQFHDEIILTVKEGYRKECEVILRKCIIKTNTYLNLNRELDIDVKFGKDYSKIH